MNNNFERILNLVRRTGDKIVVFEKETDSGYVVMDIEEYELMVDVQDDLCELAGHDPYETGDDFEQSTDDSFDDNDLETSGKINVWDVMQSAGNEGETWDPADLTDSELVELEEQYQAFANRHLQEAITETQSKEVESKSKSKDSEDDFGEESFYLEPVE
ncbi:MAG: hypothetical protein HQ488_04975 [Parcubacteria group bacterium]|nr:hypothetical protein [Parcubacteria group bacterium]